jgi:hypothetical protein
MTPFLETETAAAAGSRHTDDDVIYQIELQYSAAFENSAGSDADPPRKEKGHRRDDYAP